MTDPTLAAEFPWLRREPAPILGDSRPRSIKELLGKSRLWLDLYRDWLQSYNASYVDGLNYLTGSKAQQVEYGRRLSDAYPGFYAAAGALKDWVKKAGRGADASAQFPWVSGDPGRLVGDARPKDFEALVELGQKSDWMTLFRGWLAHEQPFDHAENWLDWVLEQGSGGESWQQALDPTVEAFAHDIGRLKDRLRETHGNAAERVGDAAERPGLVEAAGYPGWPSGSPSAAANWPRRPTTCAATSSFSTATGRTSTSRASRCATRSPTRTGCCSSSWPACATRCTAWPGTWISATPTTTAAGRTTGSAWWAMP